MFIDKQRRRSKKEDGEGLREQGTQGEVMERRRYHRIQGRRSHRRRRWIDERRRRWTERVSSAAAVGRRMGLGLGCRVRLRPTVGRRGEANGVRVRGRPGEGGSRLYGEPAGEEPRRPGGFLGRRPACLLAGRAVPACGPRVRPKHGLHPRAVPARAH